MSAVDLAFRQYIDLVEQRKGLRDPEDIEEEPNISEALASLYNSKEEEEPVSMSPTSTALTTPTYEQPLEISPELEESYSRPSGQRFKVPFVPISINTRRPRTGKIYTLDDLENDPEFNKRTERFMEEIGADEDIYEYLRDADFSLSAALARSAQIGNWSDQAKEDYIYLKDRFDNADIGSFKQVMGLVKDLGIDFISDPFNLATAFFAPVSLGSSLAVRSAVQKATAEGLNKLTKSSIKRLGKQGLKAGKQAAKYGVAEGVAFAGPHDFFLQDAEKELGLRENIDLTQLGVVAALGGTFGGILGGSIGTFTSLSPMLNKKLFRFSNEDAIIKEGSIPRKTVELNYEMEDLGFGDKVIRKLDDLEVFLDRASRISRIKKKQLSKKTKPITDPVQEVLDPVLEKGTSLRKSSRKWIGRIFGRATSVVMQQAENSPTMGKLLSELRYDWMDTLTERSSKIKTEQGTFAEIWNELRSEWQADLQLGINKLKRANPEWDKSKLFLGEGKDVAKESWTKNFRNVFRDILDPEQEEQVLKLMWDMDEDALSNVYTSRRVIRYRDKNGKPQSKLVSDLDPEVREAALLLRDLNKKIFNDLKKAGILVAGQQAANYFPRRFQHSKIKANKDKFISIIENSVHSDPLSTKSAQFDDFVSPYKIQDVYAKDQFAFDIDPITQKIIPETRSLKEGSLTYDQAAFTDRDFIQEAMAELRIKKDISELSLNQQEDIWKRAKRLKAEKITEDMLSYADDPFLKPTFNQATNSMVYAAKPVTGVQKSRVFTEISDETFEDFIDTDIYRVMTDYINGASRAVARNDKLGGGVAEFVTRWVAPIRNELRDAGVEQKEIQRVTEYLEKLYSAVTGVEPSNPKLKTSRYGEWADWLKVSQQLAHLPLATVSSLTEPLLLMARVPYSDYPQAGKDVYISLRKGLRKDLDRWKRTYDKIRGEKVTGFDDLDDETWREAYKVGLALEQAVMQRLDGLYGEAPRSKFARTIQNSFFQANLLTQWTGAVQLAAFTTGKRLIRENAEALYLHQQGIKKLSSKALKDKKEMLWDLGIDDKKAIDWYSSSFYKGQFDEDIAKGNLGQQKLRDKNKAFFENDYQRGATRFAKEIILNPSTAEANRPLWFSHPAGQLLAQFAGYPTAFNNTILKRWSQDMYRDPVKATPKLVATTILMSSVATLTNALRSRGASLNDEPQEMAIKAIQRWGGLGPAEYAYRYTTNAGFGSGQLGSLLKTPAGPIAQDAIDMLLYRKGLGEVIATNVPGYSLFAKETRDALKREARKLDKNTWGRAFGPETAEKAAPISYGSGYGSPRRRSKSSTSGYKFGGEVNVPNAIKEPDEKIDRLTGLPYNYQAGILGQDEEERFGFAIGGLPQALRSTIGLAKNKRGTAFRTRWQDEDNLEVVDTRRLKSLQKQGKSTNIVTMQTAKELLEDGQITIKEARALLRESGYKKQSIYKFIRTYKDAKYAKGDEFVTYRSGFAEGGPVDDEEIVDTLNRSYRKETPLLNDGSTIPMYSEKEAKDFSKGITETVYRKLSDDLYVTHLEDFLITDEVGVRVHTKADDHQAGKVRIYNPLDLRKQKIDSLKGSEFIEKVSSNQMLQNIIVKHSKLPKLEARKRLQDLLAEYRYMDKEIKKSSVQDVDRIKYVKDVKFGRDTKEILNELGYDSILYSKDGDTSVMLFEPGQFRAIKGKPRIVGVTENKKYFLTDRGTGSIKRQEYFLGGISKFMQQLSQKAVDVRNKWENVLDRTVEDPEERDLFRRIIDAESKGDPNAVSKRGAKGIMQIMEATARQPGYKTTPFKGDDLFNVEENIRFGTDYMRGLKNHFGDWQTASIAYNWGPGNTKKWIERGSDFNRLPKETQKYIGKIYVQPVEVTAKKR